MIKGDRGGKRVNSSRKGVLKGIASLEKQIKEHEEKITKTQNSNISEELKQERIHHWEAEINAFRKNIEKLSKKKNKNKKK